MATAATDLGAVLISPEGTLDPYPVYERMRRISPVYWSDAVGAWVVTGYPEVREVYREHKRFSSVGTKAGPLDRLSAEVRGRVPLVEVAETTPALQTSDPPLHTHHRGLVIRPLIPRKLEQKRDLFETLCEDLVESLAREERPELIGQFTTQLSYASVLSLFGASMDHVPVFAETAAARQAFGRLGGSDPEAALRYERALHEFRERLESVYDDLRGRDDETIIGALLQARDGDGGLEADEMFAILKTFFAAGHENIIYSIATAVLALLRHPEQLALVREDPALAAAAFEEAVRWDTPHQSNPRVVRADTELAGQALAAGDRMLNMKGAANRDPAVWTDPDRFDLTRDQAEPEGGTVAFGQGVHFCAGAGVARLEGPIAINALLTRFPRLRLPDGWTPQWQRKPGIRMLTELPLVLG